nr:tripartite tricarboxylate transporter substrate-binding protein [Achromobacter ruhlandii]
MGAWWGGAAGGGGGGWRGGGWGVAGGGGGGGGGAAGGGGGGGARGDGRAGGGEGGRGLEGSGWVVLRAPAGSAQEAVSRRRAAAQRARRTEGGRQRLAHDAAGPSGAGSAEFAAFIDAEERRWSQVVKEARLAAE